jgi:hypothetical protein
MITFTAAELWLGMWMHPHTITTTNDATAFQELADKYTDS